MSKQFPGVDIDAVHGGQMPKPTEPKLDELVRVAANELDQMFRQKHTMADVEWLLKKFERESRDLYVHAGTWIPVSERLPEVPLGKEQLVWICWEGDNGKRTVCDLWYVNRPYSEEYDGASWVIENESTGDGMDCVGWYEFGCSSSDDEFFMPFDRPQQIIAWMPIDKPDAPIFISHGSQS